MGLFFQLLVLAGYFLEIPSWRRDSAEKLRRRTDGVGEVKCAVGGCGVRVNGRPGGQVRGNLDDT